MQITVRLYKLHDYDLIYLYKNLQFPVRDAMRDALIRYVRDVPVFYRVPVVKASEVDLSDIKNVQFHIKLDDNEDCDVIDYLGTLKKNYRNSFLKNLLRGFLFGPACYVYETDANISDTKMKFESLERQTPRIKTLKPLKKRKERKKHIILTSDQKALFDYTGALSDSEVIIRDRGPG